MAKFPANPREERLTRANDLTKRVGAYRKVEHEPRMAATHDLLMFYIERSCDDGGFTNKQKEVLKDIAMSIVYMLDPESKRLLSPWGKFKAEWKKLSALKKIGAVVATLTVIFTMIGGSIAAYDQWEKYVERRDKANAATKQSKPATIPTSPASPTAPLAPPRGP